MIKYRSVLLLLRKPVKDAPTAMTLAVTHLDDPSLYVSAEK